MPRNPNKRQCKAKSKRTGERCQKWAVEGYEVCYWHGANPNNRGGAPKGNKNALKHGLYENVIRARLTPEEQEIFDAIPTDAELANELRILRFKLLRLLEPVEREMLGQSNQIVTLEVDEVTKAYAIEKLVDGIRKLVKDMQGTEDDDGTLTQLVEVLQASAEALGVDMDGMDDDAEDEDK